VIGAYLSWHEQLTPISAHKCCKTRGGGRARCSFVMLLPTGSGNGFDVSGGNNDCSDNSNSDGIGDGDSSNGDSGNNNRTSNSGGGYSNSGRKNNYQL
jgi:hypothetical protein